MQCWPLTLQVHRVLPLQQEQCLLMQHLPLPPGVPFLRELQVLLVPLLHMPLAVVRLLL
jgi:hypothetical protein